MMHLTREGVRRLLDGTAPPAEARAIAAHLHEDCPACDELLASSEAPALEAQVDRALTSLAPPRPDEAGNDLEFARIQRSLRSARGSTASGWRRAAAVAAAVVVVAGVGVEVVSLRPGPHHDEGVKGVAPAHGAVVPVRLSVVALLQAPGGEARMWKVADGDTVRHDAALQLRLDAAGATDVAVARVGSDGAPDVFWHRRVDAAGPVALEVGGRPAAYPLGGLAGRQRFVVLASPAPLGAGLIDAAVRALAPPRLVSSEHPALEGIAVHVLEVRVE